MTRWETVEGAVVALLAGERDIEDEEAVEVVEASVLQDWVRCRWGGESGGVGGTAVRC